MTDKIPVYSIREHFPSGIMLRRKPNGDISHERHTSFSKNDMHRHNCYLFGIQECGESRIFIDFKEYRLCGATLVCILPGQIHFSAEQKNVSGWLFGMDTLFVTGEMKEIFDMLLFSENTVTLDEQSMNDLNSCLTLLGRKMTPKHGEPAQQVARSLATAVAGMIAGLYRQKQPAPSGKRMTDIVRRFKQLLHDNLTDRKNPSQYADMLHITTQYLNKAVKHVTGSTTGSLIQHEAVLEAKRLLFYTDESVKEIAFHLGYDDCAYFTRLFTKVCGMSPVRFRENYRE